MLGNIIVKYIIVFLVSMVPLIELRGAIPIAVGLGLDKLISFNLLLEKALLPIDTTLFGIFKFDNKL